MSLVIKAALIRSNVSFVEILHLRAFDFRILNPDTFIIHNNLELLNKATTFLPFPTLFFVRSRRWVEYGLKFWMWNGVPGV
jgi:hypothetical protein